MDIESALYEVEGIDKELKRLRKRTRQLNARKTELLSQAIERMQEKGETETTYRGNKYILEERAKRARKADKQKREDALAVLADEGYHGEDAEEMFEKVTNALKGPEHTVYTLKK